MDLLELNALIQKIAIAAVPVILAITLHEAAHAYVARLFGDSTAWREGRVTANPLKHIDPLGTVIVPLSILLFSQGAFLFGWAKPVPVNFSNLRSPKRDMLWVAAAGPAANLVMAIAWVLFLKLSWWLPDSSYSLPLANMAKVGVGINVALMVLNLFPLPPLDGGRIAVSLLPYRMARQYARIEPYGFFILLALLFTGVLGDVLAPFMDGVIHLLELIILLPA